MPEGNYLPRLLLIGFILALNAFFALAETSIVSARRSRLQQMAESGNLGAQAALLLLSNPERLLSVIQVGVTLASLLLGWAGEDTFSHLFATLLGGVPGPVQPFIGLISFTLGFVLMSYMHVLIGEVVPKNIALGASERIAVLVSPVLLVIARVFSPLVLVIEKSASFVSRIFGFKQGTEGAAHSREELTFLVENLYQAGELDEFERSAIERLASLRTYSTREIMTPRGRVVAVPVTSSLDELIRTMIENQFSRLPVYEATPEKLIGVVHYKDLLRVWEERRTLMARGWSTRPFRLQSMLHKMMVVPETKPLDQLLEDFRRTPQHIAAVVDEFGTVSGIVTLEDVLEQVFGEIEDEHDERQVEPHAEASEWEFDGTVPIVDLDNQLDVSIPTDAGFETLAGFLLYKLGRLPTEGEVIEYERLRFTVLEMQENRIARVKLERLPAQEPVVEAEPS